MPLDDEYKGVWVYVQHEGGQLIKPTLELLSAGRKVANKLNHQLTAILLGHEIAALARETTEYGVDDVIYSADPRLGDYLCLPYTSVLSNLVRKLKPYAFLFLSDEVGKDLAPRVAYRLKTGLATDNIELEIEDYYHIPTKTQLKNLLIQIRPDFATRVAKIYTPWHRPQIATVRPGNFMPAERKDGGSASLKEEKPDFREEDFSLILRSLRNVARSPVELENAQAVISLGLGILRDGSGNPRSPLEGYRLAQDLAQAIHEKFGLRTEIGASRALIYAELSELHGLITLDHQVGQTGMTVSPDLYFAVGISGAVQHRVGMLRSKRIVAINLDPTAPIFQIAHYPIIGDLYQELPRLTELIRGL